MSAKKLVSVWDENMTRETEQKARDELGETTEIRIKTLQVLKQLVSNDKALNCLMDEKFLLRFLRFRKFCPEKAFKTLCNYYKFKQKYKDSFFNYMPQDVKHLLEMKATMTLPYLTQKGETILYYRAENFNPDHGNPDEGMALYFMWLDMLLKFESKQISGIILICDMKGFRYRHLWNFMFYLPVMRQAIEDCYPLRIKAGYVLNAPRFCEIFINAIKSFLSEKMKKRVYIFSGDVKKLHLHIPEEILPAELKGHLSPLDSKDAIEYFMENQELIAQINSHGYK